jgi:hypothetical protein
VTAHARLSPSGADRWCVCTASVPLIDRLLAAGELHESDLEGDDADLSADDETDVGEDDVQVPDAYDDVQLDARESSSFSAEGTVMHEVRQLCLELGLDPFNFVGLTLSADGFSFEIEPDMADRLVEGIDWVREHTNQPDVEIRVDLDAWLPGQFGTCDTGFLYRKRLFISDYKNGVGKPVAAQGNRQLRIYALGYWDMIGRPEVVGVVINVDQPRAGGMKFWEIDLAELLEFGEELRRIHARIESGNVEFVPTVSGCQWCPVRKTKRGCAAFNQWALMLLGSGVLDPSAGDPTFKDPAQMPRALRYYVVKHAPAIRSWLAKLHEESLVAAIDGDPDPGSKAIDGDEGRRYFTDKAEAERLLIDALGDKAYKPRAMIGFTEIDKKVKPGRKKLGHPETWDALQLLVDRPAGKPKLVPADHPKPAIRPIADEFDDLD